MWFVRRMGLKVEVVPERKDVPEVAVRSGFQKIRRQGLQPGEGSRREFLLPSRLGDGVGHYRREVWIHHGENVVAEGTEAHGV